MKIQVTAEDIAKGVARDCERCPISRAIRRETDAKYVSTDGSLICADDGDAATPGPAADFIHAYDDGDPVEPFEFDLELDYPDYSDRGE